MGYLPAQSQVDLFFSKGRSKRVLHFHPHSYCSFPVFDFMLMLHWNDSDNETSVRCNAHINAMYL